MYHIMKTNMRPLVVILLMILVVPHADELN